MLNFVGTYGGLICGFGGFLTAIAALLYARARVAEVERSVRDLDWQQVSEMSLDVAKLKKAAQKWQNNTNATEKVSQNFGSPNWTSKKILGHPNIFWKFFGRPISFYRGNLMVPSTFCKS